MLSTKQAIKATKTYCLESSFTRTPNQSELHRQYTVMSAQNVTADGQQTFAYSLLSSGGILLTVITSLSTVSDSNSVSIG